MLLVDSCVWIDLLKGGDTPAVRRLRAVQSAQSPEICISGIIYFEVLRGIVPDIERKRVQRQFDLLERRECLPGGFHRLVAIAIAAQRRGMTLKKLGDWLILKTLLDHSLTLLTSDTGFHRLQRVVPFAIEPV